MTNAGIPALFMRGGTSKAVVISASNLPAERAERDLLFLRLMGSPDPNGRQLNGMGGGLSSLSKVCILARSDRPDADIDYTFAQVPVNQGRVDYSGNCGNMSAAMGPAAMAIGLIAAPPDGPAQVRIYNTNTEKIIIAGFPVRNGALDPSGDFAIDGVSGSAAPIRLDFMKPGGSRTGRLLPTGRLVDELILADGSRIEASCVDAANPCVFVEARTLGLAGTELPAEIDADAALMAQLEMIRQAASVTMGIAANPAEAAELGAIPKVAMVAPPQVCRLLSGGQLDPAEHHLIVRMLSMGQTHRATPVTGAVCLAVAARLPGSLPNRNLKVPGETIDIAHPSGKLTVDAVLRDAQQPLMAEAVSGSMFRTARLLFRGEVFA